MAKILIVEDSKLFGTLVKRRIELDLNLEAVWVQSYSEARRLLEEDAKGFLVALLDLHLPDAPMGEIVELVNSFGVPAIVFTGSFGPAMRETIWSYKVVDYLLKESVQNIEYIVSLVRRIQRNHRIKVMVVDDSATSRRHIGDLLRVHQYQVLEAEDGIKACHLLEENSDIRLVITDFNMPQMDGFQLTEEIRGKYSKGELAVIGMSTQGDNLLSARFIKNGANDFITKPFLTEEFYCRVTQNIEMIENLQAIRESSNKDYLTGLFNRRYFFQMAKKYFSKAKRGQMTITVAMLDIDFFKKINDTYGHDAGDAVLKQLSALMQERVRESDILARFGGEEFCILATDMAEGIEFKVFDALRQAVEQATFTLDQMEIKATISVGICTQLLDNLDAMIKVADAMLYEAKKNGRNRVMLA